MQNKFVRFRMKTGLAPGILVSAFLLGGGSGCGGNAPLLPADEHEVPTLRMTTARIASFDPAHARDEATSSATGKIYEGLLQYSYWDRPYHLEPLLAASMPEISADGLVWTIRLRPGLYFSDDPCFAANGGKGREVTADDFVYSILRIADVKTGSSGYWLFRGHIEGLDDFRAASQRDEPTDYSPPVAGLRAIDRHTLSIRLTAPYPQLAWALAMPYAFVVPREAVETYGPAFAQHPVGTGPYCLTDLRPNYRYEYRRNPKWAETGRTDTVPANAPTPDAGQPLPLVPRIVDSVVGDPSTAWLMFLSGDLDRTSVTLDQWDSILTPQKTLRPELAARGIRLRHAARLAITYLAFNFDDPLLGPNKKLRQALTCAFDSGAWQEFQNGRIQTPNGPIPPSVAGAASASPPYPFDLARARRLLSEAGYPDGRDPATGRRLTLTLEIGSADNPEERQGAELIAAFFDRMGVRLELSFNHWPAYLQKIERRQAQLFKLTWLGDYPDAENFLQLFYGPNDSPGPNRANYHNPEMDRLYRELIFLPPSEERNRLCRTATALLMEDCPWICMAWPMNFSVRHSTLQNDLAHDFAWGTEKYLNLRPESADETAVATAP